MNKFKLLNEYERVTKELIFEYVVDFYDAVTIEIGELEYEFQNFIHKIIENNYYELEDLDKIADLLAVVNNRVKKSVEKVAMRKEYLYLKSNEQVLNFEYHIIDSARNSKERSLVVFRISNYRKYIKNMIDSFANEVEIEFRELIKSRSDTVINYVEDNVAKKSQILIDKETMDYERLLLEFLFEQNRDTEEYNKIFDYKEMIKRAEDNGYVYKWTKGSHNIFEHKVSQKIVVIPSHELGKGLSRKIIKQIEGNKV